MALGAVASDDPKEGEGFVPLFIPLVGPFITVGTANLFGRSGLYGGVNRAGGVMLIVDGLGQLAGATLLITGLALPRTVVERDARPSALPRIGLGPGSVSLSGTF